MKTKLLIIVILVCIVLVGTFLVNFLFLEKSNVEKLKEKQIMLPDDFGEEKLRRTCGISQENDVLTTMSGEDGSEIICPIHCEVVKDTCVYPLSKDEIIRELLKGPQGLTYAESKFVMNIVKSDHRVQEIIENREYTEFCCTYMYEASKNPLYVLGVTLQMQDKDEPVSIAVDIKNSKVIKIDTVSDWHGAPGEEANTENQTNHSSIPLPGLPVIENPKMQSMIDLFENKYRTSRISFIGPNVILNATNVWGETVLLVMQPLDDTVTATLTCNHNDWRNQEMITKNVLEYLKNKNCFSPALEETSIKNNLESKDEFDSNKYTTISDEGSPLVEIGTGNVVLTEDNCHRYAYWLTKYQKEKIDRYEDYPRYPPWGNQIFPLVDYCTTSGDLVKTIVDDKIQWKFQINEN
jgi:hypothetical protein